MGRPPCPWCELRDVADGLLHGCRGLDSLLKAPFVRYLSTRTFI